MTDSFSRFRCWTAADVQQTVFGDIAALGLEADPVFLAAHCSLEVNQLGGVTENSESPEQQVLKALVGAFGREGVNTTIAVTGHSGSGKSHLVRWLRAQLKDDDSRYHLVYVPRELATLRELIGRILDGLPPSDEADSVRDELDKAITNKGPEQLANDLLDRMRSVLAFELPNATEADRSDVRPALLGSRAEEGASRRNGLADLLLVPAVRDHLLAEGGAIRRIVGSLRGQREGRDERLPIFEADDLPTDEPAVASDLPRALLDLWSVVRRKQDAACGLLNEALPRAVAETLGMRKGVSLGEVFRTARRHLRGEGKELVLLFEDLAQFGLFDGELFDQFVLQPGESLAPVRAVFAVTDGKFNENVPDTVRTRLSHHFQVVGISSDEDSPVEMLLAKYLNVARLGKARLLKAWDDAGTAERESGSWVPNACLGTDGQPECPHREACWGAFGEKDEIGLYPYNSTAIQRVVRATENEFTPRVVVDSLVHDFLLSVDSELADGVFPSDRVRRRFNFDVSRSRDAIVPPGTLSEEQRDRVHRVRVIWCDGEAEPSGITEAFDLPSSEAPTLGVGSRVVFTAKPDGAAKSQMLESPIVPLIAWENGSPLPEKVAKQLRETLLRRVESRVEFEALLINAKARPADDLFDSVISANSFEFTAQDPGRRAGANQLHFPITPDGRGVRILSAVLWFLDHEHWDPTDPRRRWDFSDDLGLAFLELEEYVEDCVSQVEAAIRERLHAGPMDPSSAALVVRHFAAQVLGRPASTRLDDVMVVPKPVLSPVDHWTRPVQFAQKALDVANLEMVQAFLSACQGEGNPQVIDVARIESVFEEVEADPDTFLRRDFVLDPAFHALQNAWHELMASLSLAAPIELDELQAAVDSVVKFQGEGPLSSILDAAENAGRLAAEHKVFRPQELYARFGDACAALRRVRDSDAEAWAKDLLERENRGVKATALRVQVWAGRARAAFLAVKVIHRCLEESTKEVEARFKLEVGITPEQANSKLVETVRQIDHQLARLER